MSDKIIWIAGLVKVTSAVVDFVNNVKLVVDFTFIIFLRTDQFTHKTLPCCLG